MKKLMSFLMAAVIAFSALSALTASAAVMPDIATFTMDAYAAETKSDLDAVNWWYNQENGKYYMFMPSVADLSSVKVWFASQGDVYVGETKLVNGEATDAFAAGGEFELTCGDSKYTLVVMTGSSVPAIFINTESGNLDYIHENKENKEAGTMLLVDDDEVVYDSTLEYIKGRGNSTWQLDKKPYNIKLDEKTNLLGMGKSKKWSLIANATDDTLARNYIVYSAAKAAGIEYTPLAAPVELYINGEYRGAFLLTTRVEIDSKRVDIEDLEGNTEDANDAGLDTYSKGGVYGKFSGLLENTQMWTNIPNNPDDITGGYILEMEVADRYYAEAAGFVTSRSQPVILKGPEYASEAQVKYISDYYQDFEDAVFGDGFVNAEGKSYTEYCDMQTLAQIYIMNEWSGNMDASITSSYFYKDAGAIMKAGPLWDYDIALGNNAGNRFGIEYNNPEAWVVCVNRQYKNTIFASNDIMAKPTLFNQLCKDEAFVTAVKREWDANFNTVLTDYVANSVKQYAMSNLDSAVMNAIRWNVFDTDDVSIITQKFTAAVDAVYNYATKRTTFLNTHLGHVIENPQGATGFTKLYKDVLVRVNNAVEKLIVVFGLQNKI